MMRPLDGIKLASAKLRAHRVRTVIITGIVALLFSGVVLVLAVVAGVSQSLHSFGQEGLGGRFIVSASPIIDRSFTYNATDKAIMDRLTDETNTLKAKKTAEAKRLGIEYDAGGDQTLPVLEVAMGQSSQKTKTINQASPIAQQVLNEHARSLQHVTYTDFEKLAKAAHATGVYKSSGGTTTYSSSPTSSSVNAIVDGKEVNEQANQFGPQTGVSQLTQSGWAYFDTELLKPFVLEGQNLAVGKDGSIPVIAPVSAAQQFLKLTAPAATATSQQQLDYLVKLRSDIAGKTAQLCYRNAASAELLSTAKSQVDEMARNKNKRDYVAPALQYNVPGEACGAVTVKKDTRTAEEKKQTANQLGFKRQFENYEDPVQGVITVRIVGLVPDMNYAAGFSVKDMLKGILRSGLGQGWFAPVSAVQSGTLPARVAPVWPDTTPLTQTYYAEFASYEDARAFTKNAACSAQLSMKEMSAYRPDQADPRVTKCYKLSKYFDIVPFGNNANAIEDLRHGVWKVMRYVAPIVLLIAALVLMGVVGKIIADSRRETAVFRALGATRSSIAQIYLTYSTFIALFITAVATFIGLLGAYLLSHKFSPDLSVSAVITYNAADIHKKFLLFGVDGQYVLLVFGLILVAALLSTALPLLTNVRRNPIRDMRDE